MIRKEQPLSQRPSFSLARLSVADRILVGGSLLLLVDSFLHWQAGLNAWGGSGAFAGILMALFALILVVSDVLAAVRIAMPAGVPASTVTAGLTVGTVLFGIIKFLFVVANHPRAAAWIGLVLIVVVAYGGYMKMRAERIGPTSSGFAG
jgi:hypothetical protein